MYWNLWIYFKYKNHYREGELWITAKLWKTLTTGLRFITCSWELPKKWGLKKSGCVNSTCIFYFKKGKYKKKTGRGKLIAYKAAVYQNSHGNYCSPAVVWIPDPTSGWGLYRQEETAGNLAWDDDLYRWFPFCGQHPAPWYAGAFIWYYRPLL